MIVLVGDRKETGSVNLIETEMFSHEVTQFMEGACHFHEVITNPRGYKESGKKLKQTFFSVQ